MLTSAPNVPKALRSLSALDVLRILRDPRESEGLSSLLSDFTNSELEQLHGSGRVKWAAIVRLHRAGAEDQAVLQLASELTPEELLELFFIGGTCGWALHCFENRCRTALPECSPQILAAAVQGIRASRQNAALHFRCGETPLAVWLAGLCGAIARELGRATADPFRLTDEDLLTLYASDGHADWAVSELAERYSEAMQLLCVHFDPDHAEALCGEVWKAVRAARGTKSAWNPEQGTVPFWLAMTAAQTSEQVGDRLAEADLMMDTEQELDEKVDEYCGLTEQQLRVLDDTSLDLFIARLSRLVESPIGALQRRFGHNELGIALRVRSRRNLRSAGGGGPATGAADSCIAELTGGLSRGEIDRRLQALSPEALNQIVESGPTREVRSRAKDQLWNRRKERFAAFSDEKLRLQTGELLPAAKAVLADRRRRDLLLCKAMDPEELSHQVAAGNRIAAEALADRHLPATLKLSAAEALRLERAGDPRVTGLSGAALQAVFDWTDWGAELIERRYEAALAKFEDPRSDNELLEAATRGEDRESENAQEARRAAQVYAERNLAETLQRGQRNLSLIARPVDAQLSAEGVALHGLSDERLLGLCYREGGSWPLNLLLQRYRKIIEVKAAGKLKALDCTDSDQYLDVTSEVIDRMTGLQGRVGSRFKPDAGSFRPWLSAIIRNCCYNVMRKQGGRMSQLNEATAAAPARQAPDPPAADVIAQLARDLAVDEGELLGPEFRRNLEMFQLKRDVSSIPSEVLRALYRMPTREAVDTRITRFQQEVLRLAGPRLGCYVVPRPAWRDDLCEGLAVLAAKSKYLVVRGDPRFLTVTNAGIDCPLPTNVMPTKAAFPLYPVIIGDDVRPAAVAAGARVPDHHLKVGVGNKLCVVPGPLVAAFVPLTVTPGQVRKRIEKIYGGIPGRRGSHHLGWMLEFAPGHLRLSQDVGVGDQVLHEYPNGEKLVVAIARMEASR